MIGQKKFSIFYRLRIKALKVSYLLTDNILFFRHHKNCFINFWVNLK